MWTAHVVALVFGFVMFGTFVLVPTLLQLPTVVGYGFGKTVSEAGLFLLLGGIFVTAANAIIESVPATQTGEAISANTIARTIGFWVSAGVAVLAILATLLAPSMRKRREQALALGVTDFPEEATE